MIHDTVCSRLKRCYDGDNFLAVLCEATFTRYLSSALRMGSPFKESFLQGSTINFDWQIGIFKENVQDHMKRLILESEVCFRIFVASFIIGLLDY